jgi:formylglycine-generating enzyme required for sulfatase activity
VLESKSRRIHTVYACASNKAGILAASILVSVLVAGNVLALDVTRVPPTEVTLQGNVLCNRATNIRDWFWDPTDGDHTLVIYALEGTPEVTERVGRIMKEYPERGLDIDDALRIQGQFDQYLKYFISPGPTADRIHKQVEAGSRLLALTGSLSERDGKKWITVTSDQPAKVSYPARMLAPDRPFKLRGQEPLQLKINEKLSLKCILLPIGRFLQGSPFYQRRYQDEFPHEVVLTKPFYMSEIPVTQEIFEAVIGKNPSFTKGPRFPVERVPHEDIVEFCQILSRTNNVTVRLPTDAEWEYAARVGTSNPCFSEKYANQISATGSRPNKTPVQTKQPNAWGLYDMLCGGWHITGDFKADNVRVRQVDPKGPDEKDRRVHGDSTGRLYKTRGGPHYDHIRPNIHGAATRNGTLWEGGSPIFRIVVESETGSAAAVRPD